MPQAKLLRRRSSIKQHGCTGPVGPTVPSSIQVIYRGRLCVSVYTFLPLQVHVFLSRNLHPLFSYLFWHKHQHVPIANLWYTQAPPPPLFPIIYLPFPFPHLFLQNYLLGSDLMHSMMPRHATQQKLSSCYHHIVLLNTDTACFLPAISRWNFYFTSPWSRYLCVVLLYCSPWNSSSSGADTPCKRVHCKIFNDNSDNLQRL